MIFKISALFIVLVASLRGCVKSDDAISNTFPQLNISDTLKFQYHWNDFPKHDHIITHQIEKHFPLPEQANGDTVNCFALPVGKFQFNNKKYYVVMWADSSIVWGTVTQLYLFVPDSQFCRPITDLAYGYGSEGSQLETTSWIYDYDGDKSPDIVKREYDYYVTGDTSRCSDVLSVLALKNSQKIYPSGDAENELKKKINFKSSEECNNN